MPDSGDSFVHKIIPPLSGSNTPVIPQLLRFLVSWQIIPLANKGRSVTLSMPQNKMFAKIQNNVLLISLKWWENCVGTICEQVPLIT